MISLNRKKGMCVCGVVGVILVLLCIGYIVKNNKSLRTSIDDTSLKNKEKMDSVGGKDNCEIINIKDEDSSEVIIYNNDRYEVVPKDLIQKNNKYSKILERYKLSIDVNEDDIGKLLLNMKNGTQIFQSKLVNTEDVLVMKDNSDEYMYIFKLNL